MIFGRSSATNCILGVLILFVFLSSAYGFERPKEFRGIKWGSEVSSISGFVPDPEQKTKFPKSVGKEEIYIRPSDSLEVAGGKVDIIEYWFVKKRLTEVIIRFKEYDQYLNMKSLFFDVYGPSERAEEKKGTIDRTNEYFWYAKNNDEANVTLTWWEFWTRDGTVRRSGSALMVWKEHLINKSGL